MKKVKKISLRKKILFSSLMLTMLFICIIAFELVLRLAVPQPPRGLSSRVFRNQNGLTLLKPNIKGTQYSREFNVTITGNEFGYRAETWSPDITLNSTVPKCVIIGDSFSFGWGVEGKNVFTNFLDKRYQYINLGMPGDGPEQQFKRLKWAFSNIKSIKQVILLLYDNDISDFKFHTPSAAPSLRPKQPLTAKIKAALLHLHTVRLIARLIDSLGLSNAAANMSGYQKMINAIIMKDISIHKRGFYDTEKWTKCQNSLLKISNLCQNKAVQFDIVRVVPAYFLTPAIQQKNITACKLNEKEFNFNLLSQNLSTLFKNYKVFSPENTDGYFKYDMHLNSKGHRLLSSFINQTILTNRQKTP